VNLGIGLAKEGKRVLLIDADPQGSLSISLGYPEPDEMEETLASVMMNIANDEEYNLENTLIHHDEGVDIMPSNIDLSAIEISMVNVMSRELILKQFISAIKDRYDYIIIDCMPSLGMMTINALACAIRC
jgi:chromosome partitioning protein